jgi:predicted nucleic acid-binding protein
MSKDFVECFRDDGSLELIWSYILKIENDHNPFQEKRNAIAKWKRLSIYDISESSSIIRNAKKFMSFGVKSKDALHVSCAIEGNAEYFITTDEKLINKLNSCQQISVVNPITLAGYLDEHSN